MTKKNLIIGTHFAYQRRLDVCEQTRLRRRGLHVHGHLDDVVEDTLCQIEWFNIDGSISMDNRLERFPSKFERTRLTVGSVLSRLGDAISSDFGRNENDGWGFAQCMKCRKWRDSWFGTRDDEFTCSGCL